MTKLSKESCEACSADAPMVSDAELKVLIRKIPEWQPVSENGLMKLRRSFIFKNFAEALAFANLVGALAEEVNHHPDLLVEWGKTTVTWWSHEIRGLHRNDFILAARCDELL